MVSVVNCFPFFHVLPITKSKIVHMKLPLDALFLVVLGEPGAFDICVSTLYSGETVDKFTSTTMLKC